MVFSGSIWFGVVGYMIENAALYILTLCLIVVLQEDLESALKRAFKQQQRVNPALRVNTDIQVCCLCFDIFCYIYFTSVFQSQNPHVFSVAVSTKPILLMLFVVFLLLITTIKLPCI